jgi:hypothetical protein
LAATSQAITNIEYDVKGRRKTWKFTINTIGTYTTGGDDLATHAELKSALGASEFVKPVKFTRGSISGYVIEQSAATGSGVHLKIYEQDAGAGLAEVANGSTIISLIGVAMECEVEGY